MPSRIPLFLSCFLSVACFAAAGAFAQVAKDTPAGPAAEVSPPASSGSGIREIKPETHYLRDKDGKLVPVPNLAFEEFERLLRLDLKYSQPGPALPPYSLQELTLSGTVERQQAELTVALTIRVQNDGWVRVPLRFPEAVLRETPKHTGEGDFFLDSEKDGTGYVCWLHAAPEKVQTLTLRFTVPVREVGNESRLPLALPRATSSQLDLRVNAPDVTASVTNGVLEVRKQDQATRFLVAGLGGDFQIAWRRGEAKSSGPVLEARSETTVTIEGQRQITADIRLKVTSLRGEFDLFRVHLSPSMRLLPRQLGPTGPQVTEVTGADGLAARTLEVKLERPTVGPVEVPLLVELLPVGEAKAAEIEFAGFEIENALRQNGIIDFAIQGDWLVTWKAGANVLRVQVPETLKQRLAARFEFARRGFALRAQVLRKQTAISVEPAYQLKVEAQRVLLDAKLKYRIRGADVDVVEVNLSGWRVDSVQPESLVEPDLLEREKTTPLSIPLTPSALNGREEFEIHILAERKLPDGETTFTLPLPRPTAKTVTPATVTVFPAENVELTVTENDLQGLERQPVPAVLQAADDAPRHQPPLYFRERSESQAALFAASLRVRPRAVSVSLAATCTLDSARLRVNQQFDYRIQYEHLTSLLLDVPRAVFDAGRVRILNGQRPLQFAEIPAEPPALGTAKPAPANVSPRPARIQVDLLDKRIGPYELLVQYDLAVPSLPAEQEVNFAVPLVLPADAANLTLTGNSLELHADDTLQARVDLGAWQVTDLPAPPAGTLTAGRTYVANDLVPEATLKLRRKDARTPGSLLVRQAWIQSCLLPHGRRDRAVFRVQTSREQIQVQLPAGAELQDVGLDGQQLAVEPHNAEEITLSLPSKTPPQEYVLELWYLLAEAPPRTGRVVLEAPRLLDAKWANTWYWQVALAADQHVLLFPTGLTPELTWQREGLFWVPRAALQQRDLERLLDASPQAPLPGRLGQYLFSSFGDVAELRYTVATRSVLLLVVAGLVLLTGLLLMYFRILRHPASLLLLSLGLLLAVFLNPDSSGLVGDASGLGVCLLIVARILKGLVDWRQARRPVVRGASLASPDSQTFRSPSSVSEGVSFPTTATAPVAPQVPHGEPKP